MLKSLFLISLFCAISFSAVAQDCPRIFRRGDTLFTDPAPQYQWFRDNEPLNGATKQWFLPASKGNYRVEVRNTAPNVAVSLDLERTITGRVVDERYEPIADATVSVGQVSVKSDAKGFFRLEKVKILTENAVVTINKAGFWNNVQRVHFFTPQEASLTALLEPLRITNRFDAQKGATISERGFFLTFPPNSAVTESGQVYQGTINLSLKRAFPSEDGFGLRMPGGDFSAIDANGQEKILVSYGFMSAEMQGADGEKLKLAPDTEATLEFYIPWQENKTAPESMPLWHFDEVAGVWKPEGTARKVGPRYVGTVKHFSSWNCDYPEDRATVKGKVLDCKGNPIPMLTVNVGQRVVTADVNGEYTTFVPSETEFDITASVDTVSVTPLKEAEEREVNDLEGSAVIDAIGLIDTAGVLTVYGQGIKDYSVDGGKTFHPKGDRLTFTENVPTNGIARDEVGCTVEYLIFILPKQTDCQLLDSTSLTLQNMFSILKAVLSNEPVYRLDLDAVPQWDFIIKRFTCLQDLSAYDSKLYILPENLGYLTNLQRIYLLESRVTALPENIGQLTNLKWLVLGANQLTSVPQSIGQLVNLQSLDFSSNSLTTLPDNVGELTNLRWLYLCTNQLTILPKSIGQLINLELMYICYNKLTSVPESVGHLTNLQSLRLDSNQLTSLPESFKNLKDNLKFLYLNGNPIPEAEQAKIRSWLPYTQITF